MSPIDRLLCTVDEHPGSTIGEIAERLGVSKQWVHPRVEALYAVGILCRVKRRDPGALGGPPYAYSLAHGGAA